MQVSGSALSLGSIRAELRRGQVKAEKTCALPCPRERGAEEVTPALGHAQEGQTCCRPADLVTTPPWPGEQGLCTPHGAMSCWEELW